MSLGFDGEEETVNFGSRQMAVYESAVYETNTLAVISKDTEVCSHTSHMLALLHTVMEMEESDQYFLLGE